MTQQEFEAKLKVIEVEGARRMQNAIIAMTMANGQMALAQRILALDPDLVCEGTSIKETVTLDKPV